MDVNNDRQKFIKHFLTIAPKHCDNCGAKYSEADFKVIRSTPQGIIMHLKCQNCQNTYVLNVLNPVNGMVGTQRAPLNLDLESDSELQHFAGKESISGNDALDIYQLLDKKLSREQLAKILD
jgi:hypothetical protein